MAKKLKIIENLAGGIDLLTEKDSGNDVLILTGKPSVSRDYWLRMKRMCDAALIIIEGKKDKQKT
ncbi:MAG: hypothetical protein Q8O88_03685 [bacterium]|nr:hypothetical protein [bacterium]